MRTMAAPDLSALRIRRDDDAPRSRALPRLLLWAGVIAIVAAGAWLALGRADWIPRGTAEVRVGRRWLRGSALEALLRWV